MTGAGAAAAAFAVAGPIRAVEPHPSGHINDGYLVASEHGRYLLQRLNPAVFPDPDAVMANVVV
ncbi:MAG: aminoglycoside phosphotransferase family protein, partial [Acidimicrobiia bacterium]|nr:aminoglycoside phosphotransferase family protein [Acidimicrobiia bacterium]